LRLSRNNIGPDCATALVGGLQYLTELRYIFINDNNVDVAAAKTVITSVKKCDHLMYNVDVAAVKTVITSVKKCDHLRYLNIKRTEH